MRSYIYIHHIYIYICWLKIRSHQDLVRSSIKYRDLKSAGLYIIIWHLSVLVACWQLCMLCMLPSVMALMELWQMYVTDVRRVLSRVMTNSSLIVHSVVQDDSGWRWCRYINSLLEKEWPVWGIPIPWPVLMDNLKKIVNWSTCWDPLGSFFLFHHW